MFRSQKLLWRGALIVRTCTERTVLSNNRLGTVAPQRKDIYHESEKENIEIKPINIEKHKIRGVSNLDDDSKDFEQKENASADLVIGKMHENDENELARKADVPTKAPKSSVGFWQSERGLAIKESALIGMGRVLRIYFNKERYDNLYEAALGLERKYVLRQNHGDENMLKVHGPEWALGDLVFSLGGAVKLRYDDRWVDDRRCLRTPKKRDFRLEGIDLRNSGITWYGLRFLQQSQYVRYFNVGDAKYFDDAGLATLHPTSNSLEFLDISGTSVTERGLAYLRLYTKLKYLNISRLEKAKDLDLLIPFLHEILPEDCVIIYNDNTPSDMYGSPIPFRSPYNTKKDKPVTSGNKNIGDLVAYGKDMGEIDLYRPETIHELWMTPEISQDRKLRINFIPKQHNNFYHKMTKYILKAHDYKPLF